MSENDAPVTAEEMAEWERACKTPKFDYEAFILRLIRDLRKARAELLGECKMLAVHQTRIVALEAHKRWLVEALGTISQGRGRCKQFWCANHADNALAAIESVGKERP